MKTVKMDWRKSMPEDVRASMVIDGNDGANITSFFSGGEEQLRISSEGFWVCGVQVPQDKDEAVRVYEAFKQWLVMVHLTARQYND